MASTITPKTTSNQDNITAWRAQLGKGAGAWIIFETLTGLALTLLPFSSFNQVSLLAHTLLGVLLLWLPICYAWRHWKARSTGNFSHYQLLGYVALILLAVCVFSGLILTAQGLVRERISYVASQTHLITAVALLAFFSLHLGAVIWRKAPSRLRNELRSAQRGYAIHVLLIGTLGALLCLPLAFSYPEPPTFQSFVDDYNWRFGKDRPFAPSLARVAYEQSGEPSALNPELLANSARCGSAGCHAQIYKEWLPSAHRFSSLDDMFQQVQKLMAQETSPEHTRYCAGCHDPISLFSGAKNSGNITLSAKGWDEGVSCLVCHSIVQTDVQGNGDYTIRPAQRYLFELNDGLLARLTSDFLIRTYPEQHIRAYSRPLYKTAEFCAACHKQYIDREVNTDIGKVQGQNQYDSWKNSRWRHSEDDTKSVYCRECHMPLIESRDPARGDPTDYNRTLHDGMHRNHRTLASNQYIPALQNLEGAAEHLELTEKWLRGEIEIPEIADKWVQGPVVRMQLLGPAQVREGESFPLRIILVNNKTGHDFPTGPLDMIESWVELSVRDAQGRVLQRIGGLDAENAVDDTPVWFKADGYDRQGQPIDRHNLWDLVGARYKRALYPGMTDTDTVKLQCPSMARGRLHDPEGRQPPGSRTETYTLAAPAGAGELIVSARLLYRKANPEFLNRVYGLGHGKEAPITEMTQAELSIPVLPPELAGNE